MLDVDRKRPALRDSQEILACPMLWFRSLRGNSNTLQSLGQTTPPIPREGVAFHQ
jgi:hypothetical protein